MEVVAHRVKAAIQAHRPGEWEWLGTEGPRPRTRRMAPESATGMWAPHAATASNGPSSEQSCASFLVMEDNGISQAFTNDRHFEQAGFRNLLPA